MLINPPFLPERQAAETDEQYLARVMVNGGVGDGGYPVSFEMNWHGGVHLDAAVGPRGAVEPVRAMADGKVTFLRRPTARSSNPNHALNYKGGWTDDGVVVLEHETTIGFDAATSQETAVKYYSVYMHLRAVTSPLNANDAVFRKDALGAAGSVYGTANRVHVAVVCDDANVKKLVGRKDEFIDALKNGRTDSVYGDIWFVVLFGASFHASEPKAGQPLPPVVFTNDEALILRMRFVGPDAEFQSHHLDGRPFGNPVQVTDYVAKLMKTAMRRYPTSQSAGVELMTFGRVIGPDPLTPANAPFYREVALPNGGTGWVNLNTTDVRRFSDADFPSWDNTFKGGWVLVDGTGSKDSRCKELRVIELLDIDSNLVVNPQEAQTRLNDPATQKSLSRKICKIATEWDASTIDARYGWIRTEAKPKISEAEYAKFKAHVTALSFWQGSQPGIAGTHWHFHPREFVRQFRKCVWLSARELAQCVPRQQMELSGTTWNTHNLSWNTASQRTSPWVAALNMTLRRYLIAASPQRVLHFLAQVFTESGYLRWVSEIGGPTARYAPYYGRGLIQLTHQGNYQTYGDYRAFPSTNPATNPLFPGLGWDPDALIAQNQTVFNRNNCADTAGFYWVTRSTPDGNARGDVGVGLAEVTDCSKYVNGFVSIQNLNGLDVRLCNSVYMKYILLDLIRPGPTESVTFVWRRNSRKEPKFLPSGLPDLDASGNQRTAFVAATHTIAFPLDHQKP